MTITIHHINWLVNDIHKAVKQFSQFLNQGATIEYLPTRDVDTARFALGDAWLVLIAPRSMNSTVGKILTRRGEGLFLLSLAGIDTLTEQQLLNMDPSGVRQGIDDWQVWDISGLSTETSVLQLHQN